MAHAVQNVRRDDPFIAQAWFILRYVCNNINKDTMWTPFGRIVFSTS